MNLSQRLSRFIIGLLIGCVLSWFFFSGRGCSGWLPKEQIMGRLNSKTMILDGTAICQMRCLGVDESRVKSIMTKANVNLKESDPQAEIKRYRLDELKESESLYFLEVLESDSTVNVIQVGLLSGQSDCICP